MIVGLVLAAGLGGRFGGGKLVAPFAGEALVRWPVRALLSGGVDEVHVVVWPEGEPVPAALEGLPARVRRHAGAAGGMGSSLAAGVVSLGSGTSAVLVALGDQPTIAPSVVAALVARWRQADATGRAAIVVPVYRGERGHPVLFDAAVLPELRALEGDVGARGVVARDPSRVALLAIDLPAPPDVDTPEALDALERATRQPESRLPGA
jgi:molybdenum cofactor cytidylyltransferase